VIHILIFELLHSGKAKISIVQRSFSTGDAYNLKDEETGIYNVLKGYE
jgi:hypothetical protein